MTNQVIFGTLGIRINVTKIDANDAINAGRFAVCAAKEEIIAIKKGLSDGLLQDTATISVRGTLFRFIRHLWHEMMDDEAKNQFCHRIEEFQHTIGVEHVQ